MRTPGVVPRPLQDRILSSTAGVDRDKQGAAATGGCVDLERHGSLGAKIAGKVNRRRAAAAELALDGIPIGQSGPKLRFGGHAGLALPHKLPEPRVPAKWIPCRIDPEQGWREPRRNRE